MIIPLFEMQTRRWTHFWRLSPALAVILLGSGCACFNSHWNAAAKQTPPTDAITGAWDGQWLSDVNGHRGRLRCIIEPKTDNVYSAWFKARFWKIFTYSYKITMQAKPIDGQYQFKSEQNLGWLAGGVYHYEGQASPTKFFSTYSNKYDHGTFQMSRPKIEK